MFPACLTDPDYRRYLASLGAPDPAGAAVPAPGGDPAWRPAPDARGALVQDPDFELDTAAGPLRWSLLSDSEQAGVDGPYGYGRRASFPQVLRSDGTTVTVMDDGGTLREFRRSDTDYLPVGDVYCQLTKNDDDTWDYVRNDNGFRYRFPAGDVVSLTYRETPQGYRLTCGYDGEQRLAHVEEPAGRRVTLGYAAAGLTTVQYLEDWGGRRNTLTYDSSGNLAQVEGPTGCLTSTSARLYSYCEARPTKAMDPSGYSVLHRARDWCVILGVYGLRHYPGKGPSTAAAPDISGVVVGNRGSFFPASQPHTLHQSGADTNSPRR